MKVSESRPVSEIVSWVFLGLTSPLYAWPLELLRKDVLKGLEELVGDHCWPAATIFFAGLPDQFVLPSTLLGVFAAVCWMFSFLLVVLLAASLIMPYLAVNYGIWGIYSSNRSAGWRDRQECRYNE